MNRNNSFEKRYWDNRYKDNQTSGKGSHDRDSVHFKSEFINTLISDNSYKNIVELGCGDGNQLSYFKGYKKYTGYDISPNIISKNKTKFDKDETKLFTTDLNNIIENKYDLVLSLDVLYHLVTNDIYETVTQLTTPISPIGVYELKLSMTYSLNSTNTSAFFRFSMDGGTTWNETRKEPKDNTDKLMVDYSFPFEQNANQVVDIVVQARKETAGDIMEIYFLDLVYEWKRDI